MESKKQAKKQVKILDVAALPVVTLNDEEMSVVSGGRRSAWSR